MRVEEDGLVRGEAGRPGLARVLAACGAGEARALVVARLDRLARSLSDAAQLLARAKREGWNLVALDLGLDLSTSDGKRVANQFASVAEWERQMLSAQDARGHRREDQQAPGAGLDPAGDRR